MPDTSGTVANRNKIEVEGLIKVFGDDPDEALRLLREGKSKDEIREETGNVVAVADVSFGIRGGEIFVVMGLSGSGKSTLIRCVNRLIEPTAGQVYLDGQDIVAASSEELRQIRLRKISMVFQHFALFPHKTVAENAEYGLKIQGIPVDERRERALKALDQVGLEAWADSPPANLSGGMQQRVGLARGLAVDPEILLMDEPFSALDPLIRRDMQEELIALQKTLKMTILFITHDLHEALTLGDHIAIMKDGRFVQLGAPEEIVAEPADPYVAEFTKDVDRGRVFTAGTVMTQPRALVAGKDTVGSAMTRMRKDGRQAVFVADGEGRPVGIVTERELARGGRDDDRGLSDVMQTDFFETSESTQLADLYEMCEAGRPIAVVDDRGRLRGVVNPLDVFAELAANDTKRIAGDAAETASEEPARATARQA